MMSRTRGMQNTPVCVWVPVGPDDLGWTCPCPLVGGGLYCSADAFFADTARARDRRRSVRCLCFDSKLPCFAIAGAWGAGGLDVTFFPSQGMTTRNA
jgi:hypothetical protein